MTTMRKIYIDPDGKEQARPKSLVLNGNTYVPPTDEQLVHAGWEVRGIIDPIPEPYIPTIEELVEGKLRERYTINQEFEVQRKRDRKPQAFAEYDAYVEECITWAKTQPHREDEV